MKHTVDNSTVASNPGLIEISTKKYFDYIQMKGMRRFLFSVLFCLPEKFLFKLFGSNRVVFGFIQMREQFRYGCLNPTVVVDKENNLIATFTSLTATGNKPTPVVKISKEPIDQLSNMSIENDQRLPTVALYLQDPRKMNASAWMDFDPKIANCFTDNRSQCNELLERISENNWLCLELGLKQIDTPYKVGLYPVELDDDLVRNAY